VSYAGIFIGSRGTTHAVACNLRFVVFFLLFSNTS
jgi:hypothetical protein